jgi:pilus assembly protein CpaE
MTGLFSFGHGDEAVMHGEFMGFVLDDESLLSLRGWAERQGYPQATVQQGGPDIFAQMMESSAPPKLAIIDIDGQADPVSITARISSLCGGDCRLIIVGSTNDVTLYHRLMNAGAIDYLVKPLSPELLNKALATALRGPVGGNKPEVKEAKVVVFIGARGGVGASTIALNVGWLMAHELDQNVALFDLDLQFGTSSLALDLEPGRGLRDIVSSPNRVDALMIASSIMPESENFSILGAEEAIDEVVPVDGGAISALLKEMKGNFDAIVIDLPRHMLATNKRLLVAAQEIVIVSDLTLAGIRDTLRIKSALANIGCTSRVMIAAARVGASGAGHVTRAVFEKGVQRPIDFIIPEDVASLTLSSNGGKALAAVAPRALLTKALRELALRLTKSDELLVEKPRPSFWTKLAGGKKSKGKSGARSNS